MTRAGRRSGGPEAPGARRPRLSTRVGSSPGKTTIFSGAVVEKQRTKGVSVDLRANCLRGCGWRSLRLRAWNLELRARTGARTRSLPRAVRRSVVTRTRGQQGRFLGVGSQVTWPWMSELGIRENRTTISDTASKMKTKIKKKGTKGKGKKRVKVETRIDGKLSYI